MLLIDRFHGVAMRKNELHLIDVRRCFSRLSVIIFLFLLGLPASEGSEPMQRYGFYQNCGLSLSLPSVLAPVVDSEVSPCVNSYREESGATMLIGSLVGGRKNPDLLEKLPALHIYRRDLDHVLNSLNGIGLRRIANGSVISTSELEEAECGLSGVAHISEVAGGNWSGWIAEDFYKSRDVASSRDHCERFDNRHRCIRLVIGNAKETVAMSQYCLVRRDGDFDLDEGLSYEIFMEILKSIKLLEE
ncbi:hypothetical protein PPH94_015900 [Burkholderia cepacia]|uniref:hypothetical protein n=1 Tax=Burkholderia cepacia TaxID=292 RepID=UPI00234BF28E|nr:hypothetical protein [Burkholderia cepacia]MDC6103054.1 hypothetical protein [Burkholderia cepacia]